MKNSRRFPNKSRAIVAFSLLFSMISFYSLFLFSCTKLTISDEKRLERELSKRFSLFRQYKRSRDIQKCYEFFSERYKKKVRYEEWLRRQFPDTNGINVRVIEFEIEEIEFSENYTEANITYYLKTEIWAPFFPTPKPQTLETQPEERWVLVDGIWYREPKRVLVDVSGARFYAEDK